jgi:hypothetical protein
LFAMVVMFLEHRRPDKKHDRNRYRRHRH